MKVPTGNKPPPLSAQDTTSGSGDQSHDQSGSIMQAEHTTAATGEEEGAGHRKKDRLRLFEERRRHDKEDEVTSKKTVTPEMNRGRKKLRAKSEITSLRLKAQEKSDPVKDELRVSTHGLTRSGAGTRAMTRQKETGVRVHSNDRQRSGLVAEGKEKQFSELVDGSSSEGPNSEPTTSFSDINGASAAGTCTYTYA